MRRSQPPPSPRRRVVQSVLTVLLLALAILVVLGQANPLATRLGRDSGMYAYVASHLLRGNVVYMSAWEHKPPGIFVINALGLALAGGTRWGIWSAEFLFLSVAALSGLHALQRYFGPGPALGASLTWLAALSLVLEGGNFTEEYSLSFSFIALLLFVLTLKRPSSVWLHVALGLAAGCSFMLRPNNAGVQMAVVLTQAVLAVRGRQTRRQLLKGWILLGIGFAVPVAATTAYFIARDAFRPFLEAAFLFNMSYGGKADVLGAFVGGIKHLGFAAGVGLVGMLIAFQDLGQQWKARKLDPILLWLAFDFVLEIVLSGLSGLHYPHYFISWLPWVAAACALVIRKMARPFDGWFRRHAVPVLLGATAAVALTSLGTLHGYAEAVSSSMAAQRPLQRQEQLPAYINERTRPGETVLVWGGGAGINFLSRRDAPTAHFQYGILGPSDIADRAAAQFYADLLARPPALILDQAGDELPPLSTQNPVQWLHSRGMVAPPYLQEFFDFVHAHYSYRTEVAGAPIYAWEQ